jgi:hypothetical protein
MIGLLLAMYPAPWRQRYGEEFRAVLESRPLGPFDVADVLIGALDARLAPRGLSPAVAPDGGHVVMLRLGGFGAVAGGVLWFLGLAVSSATEGEPLYLALLAVGTIGLLLALIGLSAFQAHRSPRLAWAAFAIPAVGSVLSITGLIAMVLRGDTGEPLLGPLEPWSIWIIGLFATLIGCILFGVATLRARVLSRRSAIGLAVSSASMLVTFVASMGLVAFPPDILWLVVLVSTGSFALSWISLGILALRRGPIRAVAPA